MKDLENNSDMTAKSSMKDELKRCWQVTDKLGRFTNKNVFVCRNKLGCFTEQNKTFINLFQKIIT